MQFPALQPFPANQFMEGAFRHKTSHSAQKTGRFAEKALHSEQRPRYLHKNRGGLLGRWSFHSHTSAKSLMAVPRFSLWRLKCAEGFVLVKNKKSCKYLTVSLDGYFQAHTSHHHHPSLSQKTESSWTGPTWILCHSLLKKVWDERRTG